MFNLKKVVIVIIILVLLGGGGYYYYSNIYIPSLKPTIEVESNSVSISEYYIYGTSLSLSGSIKKINANYGDIDLIFWNTNDGDIISYEIDYKKNVNNVDFDISDEINSGIYLDGIEDGYYELYLRFSYVDDDNTTYKYYPLSNDTDYDKTVYYTTSKVGNEITIKSNDTTMVIKVKDNDSSDEIYDVVLDASGGGVDSGVTGNGYNESDLTLEMANKVKEKLETEGITVKMTRTEDSFADDEYFDEYNDGGRAVISHEVNAKYLFSFQADSSSDASTSGFSIYTAANINYDFAAKLVENIIDKTGLNTSAVTGYRVDYGIYTHNFTESEIEANMEYYEQRGYVAYNVTTSSNYLYMIRETGGIMTGAYVDDSNPDRVGVNPYYDSNIGAEAYIIDLGYLTNSDDIAAITTNGDAYAVAIANSIIEELSD